MTRLNQFFPIAEGLSKLLHPYAEVVVHDAKTNRIAAIYNNHSQRVVGDDSLLDDLEGLQSGPSVHGPFIKSSATGSAVKYVTHVLRDEAGEVLGLLCVNLDLAPWSMMQQHVSQFLSAADDSHELDTLFEDDWQEKLRTFIHNFLMERHLTKETLKREERIELVRALQEAGAFRAKNAMVFAARMIGVSRATLYNDLAKI